MLKSLLFVLLLVPSLALGSPEQQERHAFCVVVSDNVVISHNLRAQGIPKEEVYAALLAYMQALLQEGMSDSDVSLLAKAVMRGWDSGPKVQQEAQKAYEGCMSRKSI